MSLDPQTVPRLAETNSPTPAEAVGIAYWFGHAVRILNRNEEPYFVLVDVADALDIDRGNATRTLENFYAKAPPGQDAQEFPCPEHKDVPVLPCPGDKGTFGRVLGQNRRYTASAVRRVRVISQDELLYLTVTSRVPKAREFTLWLIAQGKNIVAGLPTQLPVGAEDPTSPHWGGPEHSATRSRTVAPPSEAKVEVSMKGVFEELIELIRSSRELQARDHEELVRKTGNAFEFLSTKIDTLNALVDTKILHKVAEIRDQVDTVVKPLEAWKAGVDTQLNVLRTQPAAGGYTYISPYTVVDQAITNFALYSHSKDHSVDYTATIKMLQKEVRTALNKPEELMHTLVWSEALRAIDHLQKRHKSPVFTHALTMIKFRVHLG